MAQLAGLRIDDKTLADVVAVLREPDLAPRSIDQARFERQRRELALDFAAGRISQDEFTDAVAALRAPATVPVTSSPISAEEAVARLRDFKDTWASWQN